MGYESYDYRRYGKFAVMRQPVCRTYSNVARRAKTLEEAREACKGLTPEPYETVWIAEIHEYESHSRDYVWVETVHEGGR